MMKIKTIAGTIFLGVLALSTSLGSIPGRGLASRPIADSMILNQNLSEITAPRQGKISFDQDLRQLNEMERRYRERLPRLADRPELAGAIKRVSMKKYRPSSKRVAKKAKGLAHP